MVIDNKERGHFKGFKGRTGFSRRPKEQTLQDNSVVLFTRKTQKVITGGKRLKFHIYSVFYKPNQYCLVHKSGATMRDAKIKVPAPSDYTKFSLYKKHTVYSDVKIYFKGTHVVLKRAKPGTGIIAASYVRFFLEALNIKDAVVKLYGNKNKVNTIWAVDKALRMSLFHYHPSRIHLKLS